MQNALCALRNEVTIVTRLFYKPWKLILKEGREFSLNYQRTNVNFACSLQIGSVIRTSE